jgi:hypothetical protein
LGTPIVLKPSIHAGFSSKSLRKLTGKDFGVSGKHCRITGKNNSFRVSVHFSHTCLLGFDRDLFSPTTLQVRRMEMSNEIGSRVRYGEAFWRMHHEAWQRSTLNQREYCEAHGIPLKAFGNWRARFKAEPQVPTRKLLYRRGGLSHALSHRLSHGLSHDLPTSGPIVPPAREGRRRKFGEAEKRQILEEAMRPDARFSEVARRYGIAERVLFRWKQELTQVAPLFVTVEITDAAPAEERAS